MASQYVGAQGSRASCTPTDRSTCTETRHEPLLFVFTQQEPWHPTGYHHVSSQQHEWRCKTERLKTEAPVHVRGSVAPISQEIIGHSYSQGQDNRVRLNAATRENTETGG